MSIYKELNELRSMFIKFLHPLHGKRRIAVISIKIEQGTVSTKPSLACLLELGFHLPNLGPIYFTRYRYKNVTICARVQPSAGLKAVALVPEVISSLTAQSTASA